MAADLIILNGHLKTFDPARPRATALAITDGRITAVGDESDIRALAGSDTRMIDAQGGTVLPGFIESHIHLFAGQLCFRRHHGRHDHRRANLPFPLCRGLVDGRAMEWV